MAEKHSTLKRALQPMPDFVRQALLDHELMRSFQLRPAYQRNDYMGWINRAKRQATREKRLTQMLNELRQGGVYMNMRHPASLSPRSLREEKVFCHSPAPGKRGVKIARWKYDLVRQAILQVLPRRGEGLAFGELSTRVEQCIPEKKLEKLGSTSWYTTTVKLDLEAKGEISRVQNARPQRLIRNI